MRLKLDDCPPALRAKIEDAIRKQDAGNAPRIAQDAPKASGRENTRPDPVGRNTEALEAKRREPNKTEAEYNRLYLGETGRYEALTLRLPGGSRYTPDWVVFGKDGSVTLHEVKGSYRLGSHGRALTAFREAVAAFPFFDFVWSVRKGPGDWDVRKHKGAR